MHRSLITFLVVSVILSGCSMFSMAIPTMTPTAPATIQATKTSPPPPTSTIAPTATVVYDVNKIQTLAVLDGFTISIPIPLIHQTNRNIVSISDPENTLNISFAGDGYDGVQPMKEVIDSYLASLEKRGAQFQKSDPVDIQVDGATGVSVALTAKFGTVEMEGEAVAVSPRPGFLLFGLGLSKTDPSTSNWESKGRAIFEQLLNAIKFTSPGAECPISTDKMYGYKEENPIQVGGDDFEGPSRERAYLDHLRGPHGEELSYEREGSLSFGETILDAYHITGSGVDVILYIDEYNFAEPQAPVGFTCQGTFPLSAP